MTKTILGNSVGFYLESCSCLYTLINRIADLHQAHDLFLLTCWATEKRYLSGLARRPHAIERRASLTDEDGSGTVLPAFLYALFHVLLAGINSTAPASSFEMGNNIPLEHIIGGAGASAPPFGQFSFLPPGDQRGVNLSCSRGTS